MKQSAFYSSPSSLLFLVGTTVLWSCASDEALQELPAAPEIDGVLLRSAQLGPSSPSPRLDPGLMAPGVNRLGDGETGHFLVHFTGEASSLRPQLIDLGARIDTYLPVDSFLITLSGARARVLQQRQGELGIDYLEPYHPAYKISPEVAGLTEMTERVRLLIHLFPDADLGAAERQLEALGLEIDGSGGTRFQRIGMRLSGPELVAARDDIARMPEVYWIELRGEVRLLNDQAVPILQSGSNNGQFTMGDHGLHGEGQVIGFLDTGADYDACQFRDSTGRVPPLNQNGATRVDLSMRKIIAYDFLYDKDNPTSPTAYDNLGHGSHVGGNAAGDNLAHPVAHDTWDGMATAAQLVVQDGGYQTDDCADLPALGCPVVDLKPFFQQAYDQGARVHTDSWGDNENSANQNNYSAGCQDVDTFMYAHPDFLLLFAGGNSGPSSGTVGSPATSKNALAVGGTGNGSGMDSVSSFSSRGPTTDGRFKPDILAPATNTSADSDNRVDTNNCASDTGSGTSYASPLVAGAAALVRQYFTEGFYPSGKATATDGRVPSAALLKAVLVNSGVGLQRLGDNIPNMDQGWGRVSLDTALPFAGSTTKLKVVDGSVSFGASSDASYTVTLKVTSGSTPLKVTLVWTDPPSTPAAAINLVNDLDLSVQAPRASYLGNVFRRGVSVTGGNADARNNLEQVLLASPTVGTYTVTVTPHRIAEGKQNFALVIRGAVQ